MLGIGSLSASETNICSFYWLGPALVFMHRDEKPMYVQEESGHLTPFLSGGQKPFCKLCARSAWAKVCPEGIRQGSI